MAVNRIDLLIDRFDADLRKTFLNAICLLRNQAARSNRARTLRHYRAEAIAKAEAMAALHRAQQDAIAQAIGSGSLDQSAVLFVWNTARDNRARDSDAVMDGQTVKFGGVHHGQRCTDSVPRRLGRAASRDHQLPVLQGAEG